MKFYSSNQSIETPSTLKRVEESMGNKKERPARVERAIPPCPSTCPLYFVIESI
jgi:hypothetical protein